MYAGGLFFYYTTSFEFQRTVGRAFAHPRRKGGGQRLFMVYFSDLFHGYISTGLSLGCFRRLDERCFRPGLVPVTKSADLRFRFLKNAM